MQLVVLVALATIGGVITAATLLSSTSNRTGSALERLIRADALAMSGFFRLEAAIADPLDDLEQAALAAGRAQVQIGDTAVRLAIEGESGKIDVLRADDALVGRYLINAGISNPQTVVMELAKERAKDAGDAALGVIREALVQNGNRWFWEDFTRFGSEGIEPAYASSRVLQSLPDLTTEQAGTLVRLAPQERAQSSIRSGYFAAGGTTFSLVAVIDWSQHETSEWRLPIQLSSSGRALRLAGPSL